MSASGERSPPLPAPQVSGCDFDDGFAPPLAVMRLDWPAEADGRRLWSLPGRLLRAGPPPHRFGLRVQRRGPDCYAVCLVWDAGHFLWPELGREQILSSDLAPLLAALGTDLAYLLDQPIRDGPPLMRLAQSDSPLLSPFSREP
jgi:hypothetical protein